MLELVLANLKTRPFRTVISIVGVALGVVLVVLFTGLARGMSNDMAKRAANWKAEIVFARPGGTGLMSSTMNVSTSYAPLLLQIEGVQAVVPVGKYIATNNQERFGIQQIDGVEWQPFAEMNDIRLTDGKAALANDEILVDERYARQNNVKPGGTIELFNKSYKVTGVFSPPAGARLKLSLAGLQDALQAPNKSSFILVKITDGADVEAVARRINETLPGNEVNLTRDLIIDSQERIPALKAFLRVLVGLGAFVSMVFVLISMYTTVTERRKEIGILKSLGASKSFIIRVIEGEAFLIGVFGILLGFAASFVASQIINRAFELEFEFSRGWILTAVVIAVGGSLVGALYPAWRAADIDPVLVLTNE